MDLVEPLRTFVRVVEAGSFTAVAAERNSTQPTVSRQVAALEEHLGVRLLARTTRALALTDDGRLFYEQALRVLEALAEAEGAVGSRRASPSGLLRLATPVVFGRLHVLPRLPRLLERHPDLKVELLMNDGFADLVEEGIDVAIRVGEVADPGLVARRVGETRRVTVAAPSYLARRGVPQVPADLTGHDCILYTRLATGNRWTFGAGPGEVTVAVDGRFRVNNSEGVREAVLAGLGIGVVPVWVFRDEIERGLATVLLPDHEPRRLPIHAVYPSRRFLPLKVRVLVDFLAEEFHRDPLLGGGRV